MAISITSGKFFKKIVGDFIATSPSNIPSEQLFSGANLINDFQHTTQNLCMFKKCNLDQSNFEF